MRSQVQYKIYDSLSLSLSPPQVYLFVTDFSRLPAIGNMTILKD